jgi:hypothetical protein
VVALRHVEKRLIRLHAAGTLTGTATRHCEEVSILRLCCTLVARLEITSLACEQKENTFICPLE